MTMTRTGVLHVHSNYSHDGRDTLEELRDAALRRGIQFVALTDHAEDLDASRFEEFRRECAALSGERVALIPGLEFRFAGYTGLHLLALGLRQWIAPASPAAFIAGAREAAQFTIVAHPVLAGYRIPPEVLDGIDAIEVWNAAYNTRYLPDPRAVRILHALRERRPEVVGTVGLDQHDSRNDRETRVMVATDSADVLAELKAGRFTNRGRTMRFDATVSFGPARMAALTAARWALDVVERRQDRLVHAWRARSKR
ncbi:MAG TPA: PHP domain-containing protein [Gemmatimonadaceae bacterium]|nr:PHP domain-containing protein [Gemmatimonadaceae bacterium]